MTNKVLNDENTHILFLIIKKMWLYLRINITNGYVEHVSNYL